MTVTVECKTRRAGRGYEVSVLRRSGEYYKAARIQHCFRRNPGIYLHFAAETNILLSQQGGKASYALIQTSYKHVFSKVCDCFLPSSPSFARGWFLRKVSS
jgi:hypothetical protein